MSQNSTNEKNTRNIIFDMVGRLGWPLFWGLSASVGFYTLVHEGVISNHFVTRYFAGHPIEYIETIMFFVGISALTIRLVGFLGQYRSLTRIQLEDVPAGGQPVGDSSRLLESLAKVPSHLRKSYLARRLHDALEYVRRRGTTDGLDEQIKYLADVDAVRSHESNGLVRIIIWATPMLGFLGTVIGITLALGGLNEEMLVDAPKEAMKVLLAGLSVAFDTTALALSLSMVLMFLQFLTDQFESQLLAAVDARVESELVGRFEGLGTDKDPQVAHVKRMSEAVIRSSEELVRRQADLWRGTVDAAHNKWSELVGTATGQIELSLGQSLGQALEVHAAHLARAEETASARTRQFWESSHKSIQKVHAQVHEQQAQLVKQGAVLLDAVAAAGKVARLEQALNQNLKTLAGAKHFEETVMSLSAAIHLLNVRLSDSSPGVQQVSLSRNGNQNPASAEGRVA